MDPIVLRHGPVTLRPLRLDDAAGLISLIDEEIWAGMSRPQPRNEQEMREHLDFISAPASSLCFAVEFNGELVGQTTYYDHVPEVRVEIGNTYYARPVWGSVVNPTAKYLLLEHAFEVLEVQRVALRCDHRNVRSHGAITKLGARFEGTLRRYRPAADGSIADVDYFSVLRDEWPRVRAGLEARIALD